MSSANPRAPFRISTEPDERELVAKYARALGDPTRLAVIAILAGGEQTVGELATAIGASQSRLSNHLAALRWCGLVATRRTHREVRYRLADPRVLETVELLRALVRAHSRHGAVATAEVVPAGPDAPTPSLDAPAPPPAFAAAGDEPSAAADDEADNVLVAFSLGDDAFALPVRFLVEVAAARRPRPLPGGTGPSRGILEWRGAILEVLDLRAALGLGGSGPEDVLLVIGRGDGGGERVGLLVDAVAGIIHVPASGRLPAPVGQDAVAALASVDDRLVAILRPERLLVGPGGW